MPFQNPELEKLASPDGYSADAWSQLVEALRRHGTLTFDRLPSGLFPATHRGEIAAVSGYENVWVRDNVHIAYAHYVAGEMDVAVAVARRLLEFYSRYRFRFEDIIHGVTDPRDVSKRPHARFDGNLLEEVPSEKWAHAQNDALGYFLWFYTQLAHDGHVNPHEEILALFPRYFAAIRYWEDEDSGHWEEARKISASSIGVVVAGLESYSRFRPNPAAELAARGRAALNACLPHECAQIDPAKNRRYDSALLFLLFPLNVIDGPMAELLLHDNERYLSGEYGIRRYLGDSYWAPDYDLVLSAKDRTRDFSDDMQSRDALLKNIGDEAQWCIFDPILSCYYGRQGDRERQTRHFHRALSQITASWECPELYYRKNGVYVPGPHLPLQWTQANLLMALQTMQATVYA